MSAEVLGGRGIPIEKPISKRGSGLYIPAFFSRISGNLRKVPWAHVKQDIRDIGKGSARGLLVTGVGFATVEYIAPEVFRQINMSFNVVYNPYLYYAEVATIGISGILAMYAAHRLTGNKP